MDQSDFLRYVVGDHPGYLEVVVGGAVDYLPYPLRGEINESDARFRPVVVPSPQYDLTTNGVPVFSVPTDIDPKNPLSVPPSIKEIIGRPPEGGAESEHAAGSWRLSAPISYSELRLYHRKLDPLGQLPDYLPFPDTLTTKWGEAQRVEVERQPSYRTWSQAEIRQIDPFLAAPDVLPEDLTWQPTADELGTGVQFWLASHLDSTTASRIGKLVATSHPDLDKLLADLLNQRFSLREVIWIAAQTDHPFRALRYDAMWELARYIARAAASLQAPAFKAITRIRQLRSTSGTSLDKMDAISGYVVKDMQARGTFLHQTDNTYWYVDAETGEPIELSRMSERMHILLTHRYGVNRATQEHTHAADQVITTAGILPRTATAARLAYYRPGGDNGQLHVHFGGRDVGVLTADSYTAVRNGEGGLIFHLPGETDPVITTSLRTDTPREWWDEFLPPSYFRSLVGMTPTVASALLRVWAQFVLFRDAAPSRPLVAFLGPPEAGKSTLARRLYGLLYGGRKELAGQPEGAGQFDTMTSNSPFVVFDNIDRCPSWLPARLELSITPRDQEKRKLYTDNSVYLVRCDAIVGLTAHDASIFREGIFSRFLALTFRKLTTAEQIPESRLDRYVIDRREDFLCGLLSDAQRILRTPRPIDPTADWEDKIRIMDFVDMGAWFAGALGCLPEFKEAISKLKTRQTSLILEGESSLVDALEAYASSDPTRAQEWQNASTLLSRLIDHAPDQASFTLLYKTAPVLASKLGSVYAQLHPLIGVEVREDPRSGRRFWRIAHQRSGDVS